MAKLNVKVKDISESALFSHKKVQVGSNSFETPIKSIDIGHKTRKDPISDKARGMNEIWSSVDGEKLDKARGTMNDPIGWQTALNKTKKDEFNLAFLNYRKAERVTDKNLKYMLDATYSASDIITTPVFNGFYSEIDGLDSKYWKLYKRNVERFVQRADNKNGKPIMGVLPHLPWDFTEDLVNFYLDHGVRAFAFDFNARSVTAGSRITNMVAPLLTEIAQRDLQEDTFFYCLNASRGRRSGGKPFIPSKDYISLGAGFDVLGGKHTAINMPPDILEKAQDSATKVRIFDREGYYYQDHRVGEELRENFPDDSELSVDRVIDRLRSNDSAKYDYEPLINGEQQSFENKVLRTTIDENRVSEHLRGKDGVSQKEIDRLDTAKTSYKEGKNQKSLKMW